MYPHPITTSMLGTRLSRSNSRPIPRASEIELRVRRLTRFGA